MSPASFKNPTSIFSLTSSILLLTIALLYIIFASLLVNYQLVMQTLSAQASFSYKFILLLQLAFGFYSAFGVLSSIFLITNGLLVGFSCILIFKTLATIKGMGKVKISIGGASLIGLVTAGCGACGFTIFSLLGVSSSLSFLPLHGLEVHMLTFAILLFSAIYMLKKLLQSKTCKLI